MDIAGKLEFADKEFFVTMINMLRAVMEKADNMEEQTDSINKEMEIL